MANFSVQNVALTGLSVAIPKAKKINSENVFFSTEDIRKFSETTGILEFRVADEITTTSDLGFEAAQKLIFEMNIDKNDIDILIFVSQTSDYVNIPNTAPLLQHRLGLPKTCLAFDIPLGCSGFVYGLSTIVSYMQNPIFKKGILICGDTISRIVNPQDKSAALLFGDAASAAIIERKVSDCKMHFNLGSDGSGSKAIIINDGGSRNPLNENSMSKTDYGNGVIRNQCQLAIDGMEVFSFGITEAPKSVKELLKFVDINIEEIDFAVFHQANKLMNEMIRKKLKLETQKVPYSLEKFGNTSSASIPVTMVTELKDRLKNSKNQLLLCGFGVGLSWGTCFLTTENLIVPDLIEI